MIVSFQIYEKIWHPRYINGEEVQDWLTTPPIHEFINWLGNQGWEMCAASAGERMYSASDAYQLYFKRRMS